MPRGRPSLYTQEIAEEICRRLADGESLRAICETEGMPDESTVRKWALDDVEGFFPHYARAREIQAWRWADEIREISDTTIEGVRREFSDDGTKEVREDMLGHRKLQVDSRKWLLSKMLPKVFGDKVAVGGDPDAPPVQVTVRRIVDRGDG